MIRWPVTIAVALALAVSSCASEAPEIVTASSQRYTDVVTLPAPDTRGSLPLEAALASRRSVRSYGGEVALSDTSQLLWAGQGVTGATGYRTAPSAGARYPIELYAVTSESVMHYLPRDHAVEQRADARAATELARAAFGQDFVGTAPLVIAISAVFERTEIEYGAVAHDLVNREAGHVAQNILLQATALGLGAVPVGGFDPAAASDALALPPGEEVLYLIPVG